MEKTTLKSNLRIGLGLSLLILFITSLASFISIKNLIRSSDMVSHSNEMITKLESVISTLKDAETGQRGYLLTGDKDFLAPFHGAKEKSLSLLTDITLSTRDNAFQQQNVKLLQDIIEERLDIIEKTLVVKARGGNASVDELLNGKTYMEKARAVTKKMQAEEIRLLEVRTNDLNEIAAYTPILIIIAAVLAVLITIFFYRKVSMDFTTRMRLQQELQQKN
ncbi:MAG: histidine kinase, partial [Flavobacterium sp.]